MSSAPSRRSKRLKDATKETHHGGNAQSIVTTEVDENEPPLIKEAPASKRRKVSKEVGREPSRKQSSTRTKGKLGNIPKMPLDILFEIFKLLTPLDLLRLARTNKDLHSILMRPSALTVWQGARRNVPDLPDCPEGVAEPAYANFMFTTNCYECLAPRATHTFAPHLVRYCKKCVNDKVFWNPWWNPVLRESICFARDVAYDYLLTRRSGRLENAWLRADFYAFQDEYLKIQEDDDKTEELIAARRELNAVWKKQENLYARWVAQKQEARTCELDEARTQRANAIEERLTQAGWGPTLENMNWFERGEFEEHTLVKQARPLTDRIWNNIAAQMMDLMHKIRDSQLERELQTIIRTRRRVFVQVVNDYAKTQPVDAVLPSPADLYLMETVRPIKEMIEDSPVDVEFSPSHLTKFIDQLPQLCEEWKVACTAKLLDIYNAGMSKGKPANEDVLSLAKTIFICRTCAHCASYPHILNHRCVSRAHRLFLQFVVLGEDLQVAEDLQSTNWLQLAHKTLLCAPKYISMAAEVVYICGFDPDVATHDDLDNRPFVLACNSRSGVDLMGWRRAVMVSCEVDHHTDQWTKLEMDEIQGLDEVMKEEELLYYIHGESSCVCTHCRDALVSDAIVAHMIRHKRDEPVARSDFWVHPDNPYNAVFSYTLPDEDLI